MQDRGEDLAQACDDLLRKSDRLERLLEQRELDRVRRAVRGGAAVVREVPERGDVVEVKVVPLIGARSGDEVVENVEVALALRLKVSDCSVLR